MGTEDAIHIIRRVFEECHERNHEIQDEEETPMAGLMDLRKAYPSIQRDAMWEIMERKGMRKNGDMLRTLKGLHEHTEYACRVGNQLSEQYRPKRGLREGCPSSPICLNIFHDQSVRHMREQRQRNAVENNLGAVGLKWKWRKKTRVTYQQKTKRNAHETLETTIDNILFADDTTMIGSRKELQVGGGMETVTRALTDFQQKENEDKRKWIELGRPNNVRFLGTWLDLDEDMKQRIKRGYGAWAKMRNKLAKSRILHRKQAQIVRATVMTTMLYACKSRPWREYEYSRIQSVMDRCYRYIVGQNLRRMADERKNMFDIRKSLGVARVKREIEKQCMEWCGHVMRMADSNLVKQTVKGWLDNKTLKLGKIGAKPTLQRFWKRKLPEMEVDAEYLEVIAGDRTEWRRKIRDRYEKGCLEDDSKSNEERRNQEQILEGAETRPPEVVGNRDGASQQMHCCGLCQKSGFATRRALMVHNQLQHQQQREHLGGYECQKGCKKMIKTPQARGIHERTCLGDEAATKAEYRRKRNESRRRERELRNPAQFFCDICQEGFATKAGLSSHMRFHQRVEAPLPREPRTTCLKRIPHRDENGECFYQCRKGCGKTSRKAGSIARHENSREPQPQRETEVIEAPTPELLNEGDQQGTSQSVPDREDQMSRTEGEATFVGNQCDRCTFVAKTKCGLGSHNRCHLRKDAAVRLGGTGVESTSLSVPDERDQPGTSRTVSQTEREEPGLGYKCERCTFVAKTKGGLGSHNRSHLRKDAAIRPPEGRVESGTTVELEVPGSETRGGYPCDRCSLVARTAAGLSSHRRSHERADLRNRGRRYETEERRENEQELPEARVEPETKTAELEVGQGTPTGFPCDRCSLVAKSGAGLSSHKRSSHLRKEEMNRRRTGGGGGANT